jgi:hypothetical protein
MLCQPLTSKPRNESPCSDPSALPPSASVEPDVSNVASAMKPNRPASSNAAPAARQ